MVSNDPNKNNELNKNKKQTRTARNKGDNRSPKWQLIIIAILFVVLFYLLFRIFAADSNPSTDVNSTNSTVTTTEMDSSSDTSSEEVDSAEDSSEESSTEEDNTDENEETEDADVSLEESDSPDSNVQTVYTGNWQPVGTNQEGPHDTTDFAEGSADRVEIKRASSMASGIPESDIIEWWIGNDGPNRVEATISNRNESEIYRIYMEWVDNEGWKPLRMEKLIENDKKN